MICQRTEQFESLCAVLFDQQRKERHLYFDVENDDIEDRSRIISSLVRNTLTENTLTIRLKAAGRPGIHQFELAEKQTMAMQAQGKQTRTRN
jgi:hypothetical protein